jgi:DNA-binding MarR family transcriptional regulator
MAKNSKDENASDVRRFRALLRSLVRALDGSLQAKTAQCGVSTAQCHLLLEADGHGQGSIGEYADRLDIDQSCLSRTVDNLVKLGYVEREPDPVNRRRQLVKLSKSGQRKADGINKLCDDEYGRVLQRIPVAKRKALCEGLDLLVMAMNEARAPRRRGNDE